MKTRTLHYLLSMMAALLIGLPSMASVPGGEEDTVIIESNGTKIIIQTDSSSDLNGLSSVDINRMVEEITRSMTAASEEMARELAEIERAEEEGRISEDEADERRERAEEEMERQVEAMEEELEAQMEALEMLSEEMERRVIIETEGGETIFGYSTDDDLWEGDDWDDEDDWDDDDWEVEWDMGDNDDPTVGYFDLSIGLNNYLDADGNFPTASEDGFAVKTWSMHWGLGFGAKTRLGSENSPAQIKYGVEIAWSNYNYEGTFVPVKTEDEVIFVDNLQTGYDKNKMNVTTINIPLMLQLTSAKALFLENGFNLGFGGYAGFRTGSNGKFKYRDDNNEKVKMKTKSDYFLTDFQYGLQAQIGIAGVNFFARYGLNTLFQENRGPELTPVVFGIVL
ncbi:outer membrane beta-barrel protein [Cryomorphaceae bacterium]|nr:outer membrane beta-barrel protein [Cryomorphaceae bacterium]